MKKPTEALGASRLGRNQLTGKAALSTAANSGQLPRGGSYCMNWFRLAVGVMFAGLRSNRFE